MKDAFYDSFEVNNNTGDVKDIKKNTELYKQIYIKEEAMKNIDENLKNTNENLKNINNSIYRLRDGADYFNNLSYKSKLTLLGLLFVGSHVLTEILKVLTNASIARLYHFFKKYEDKYKGKENDIYYFMDDLHKYIYNKNLFGDKFIV